MARYPRRPARPKRSRRGFTLVELLVVIGIIALLISILLPALATARRQGAKVKCAAQMRDLGNAMLLYVHDNKGYLPPPRLNTAYVMDPLSFKKGGPEVYNQSINENVKWWNFLGRYMTRKKTMAQNPPSGNAADEMGQFMRSVFWCPAFEGYVDAGSAVNLVGGLNRNFTGYGMNWHPSLRADYPVTSMDSDGFPASNKEWFRDCQATGSGAGTWYKLTQFTHPGERALLADGRQFYLEAKAVAAGSPIPGQKLNYASPDYSSGVNGQCQLDFYRHGTYPPVEVAGANAGYFRSSGGKVGYNVLFADNHVESPIDRESGYKAIRMRFPG